MKTKKILDTLKLFELTNYADAHMFINLRERILALKNAEDRTVCLNELTRVMQKFGLRFRET